MHIVGNGTEPGPGTNLKRSNAHTIDWDGNAWFAGNIKVGGTGQDDTNAKKLATRDEIEVKHYVWNGSSSSADETVLPLFKEMKKDVSKGYLDGVIETSEFTKIIDIDNYLTVLTDSTEINPILNNFNETYNEEELAYLINFEGEYNNLTIPLIKYTNGINTILNYAIYNAYFILPQYDGQNAFDFIYSHKKIYSNIFYDNNDNNYYYWTLYIDMEIVEDKPKFNGCIIRKQLDIASTNYVNNICGNISTVLDSIIGQNGDIGIIS